MKLIYNHLMKKMLLNLGIATLFATAGTTIISCGEDSHNNSGETPNTGDNNTDNSGDNNNEDEGSQNTPEINFGFTEVVDWDELYNVTGLNGEYKFTETRQFDIIKSGWYDFVVEFRFHQYSVPVDGEWPEYHWENDDGSTISIHDRWIWFWDSSSYFTDDYELGTKLGDFDLGTKKFDSNYQYDLEFTDDRIVEKNGQYYFEFRYGFDEFIEVNGEKVYQWKPFEKDSTHDFASIGTSYKKYPDMIKTKQLENYIFWNKSTVDLIKEYYINNGRDLDDAFKDLELINCLYEDGYYRVLIK